MKVRVNGEILIEAPTPEIKEHFVKLLTVKNPAYVNAQRLGFSTYGITPELKLYRASMNALVIPRGLWRELNGMVQGAMCVDDCLVRQPRVDFPQNKIQLRPYQERALREIKSAQGILIMPCGGGKTETALELIARIRQPALWITHTKDLVEQVVARAQARLGLSGDEIGVIGGGKKASIGTHLTVATVQTLYRMDVAELAGRIGAVVVDECHRVVANPTTASMFAEVLACLPAYYRYGITASENRGDGLEATTRWVLGPVLAKITQEELEQSGCTVVPTLTPVITSFEHNWSIGEEHLNFNRVLDEMGEDTERSKQIAGLVIREARQGHSVLVLATTLKILRSIMAEVPEGIPSAIVDGHTPVKQRLETIDSVRDGRTLVLFATYPLAKEGLDIPRLDRLILAAPVRAESAVQQSVGRIMRPAPGKRDAIVYDVVDAQVPALKRQFNARKRVYKKLKIGGTENGLHQ